MLSWKPSERQSAAEAMNHRWVQPSNGEVDMPPRTSGCAAVAEEGGAAGSRNGDSVPTSEQAPPAAASEEGNATNSSQVDAMRQAVGLTAASGDSKAEDIGDSKAERSESAEDGKDGPADSAVSTASPAESTPADTCAGGADSKQVEETADGTAKTTLCE